MKTIARLSTLGEAQSLKIFLGSEGIEAFIPDEVSAGLLPTIFLNKSGVRVQVTEEDVEAAREIVERWGRSRTS